MALGQSSTRIHHLKQILWLIFMMEISGGEGRNSSDITINCAGQQFIEGEVIKITCEINGTSISNAGCLIPPTSLDFKVAVTSVPLTLCSPDYPPPPSSCTNNVTKGACFCAQQNGDIYTYQYNLIASAAYQGGNITCDICASPGKIPTKDVSENCTNISVETTTSTTTTTTAALSSSSSLSSLSPSVTAFASSSSSSLSSLSPSVTGTVPSNRTCDGVCCNDEPHCCEWWCILIIIIIIILLIITIIIVVRRTRRHKWAIAIEDWNGCAKINRPSGGNDDHDYGSSFAKVLEFEEGATIKVLEHEGSFWQGVIGNQAGSFPKDFVTGIKNIGNGDMTVKASCGWKKNDELTFSRGNRILIIQQKETVWQGKLKDRIGWFPCEKVKLETCCGCCVRTQEDSQGMPLNSVHNSHTA